MDEASKSENSAESSAFEAYLIRFSQWALMHNYAKTTVETRERGLRGFFVWAELRGLSHPKDITRPILQRYQRHLY